MPKKPRILNRCATAHCAKDKVPGKNYCHACSKRRWRMKNAMKAAWGALRDNATRRQIFFDLTFDQFAAFCYGTEYMARRGKTKYSYSVDRMDETKGYTVGNLQILTLSQNSQKEILRRKMYLMYDWQTRTARVLKQDMAIQQDLPF